MNNKKTILQRAKIGIKEGWQLETLPKFLLPFHNLLLVKIFRYFIGPLNIFFIATKINLSFLVIGLYLNVGLGSIYIIYMLFTIICRIINFFYLLFNGKIVVRN